MIPQFLPELFEDLLGDIQVFLELFLVKLEGFLDDSDAAVHMLPETLAQSTRQFCAIVAVNVQLLILVDFATRRDVFWHYSLP